MREFFEKVLLSFAIGDAMGMPTEFMTKEMIKEKFGFVSTLLDTSESLIHKELKRGMVTDDTEQVVYLIRAYYDRKKVDPYVTTDALLRWIEETDAISKSYIGPSSLHALNEIKKGKNPKETGKKGTTCGAPMRVLAPALSVRRGDLEALKNAIYSATLPTHNTNLAMEAAFLLGYVYHFLADGKRSLDKTLKEAFEFGEMGRELGDGQFVGPSSVNRIKFIRKKIDKYRDSEDVINFLYDIIGCTMESVDVVSVAFGIFFFSKEDTWLSVRMGASIGGDTDTIAAISGALSYLYGKNFNIPSEIMDEVEEVNNMNFKKEAEMIVSLFGE